MRQKDFALDAGKADDQLACKGADRYAGQYRDVFAWVRWRQGCVWFVYTIARLRNLLGLGI